MSKFAFAVDFNLCITWFIWTIGVAMTFFLAFMLTILTFPVTFLATPVLYRPTHDILSMVVAHLGASVATGEEFIAYSTSAGVLLTTLHVVKHDLTTYASFLDALGTWEALTLVALLATWVASIFMDLWTFVNAIWLLATPDRWW